jgi:hypothetical protein
MGRIPMDRLPTTVASLLRYPVVAMRDRRHANSTVAKAATSTIRCYLQSIDLAITTASFNRPGGNITGRTPQT